MPKPKYRQQLEDVAGMRGWDVNEIIRDNTYNYEHFYNAQPKEAQAMLKRNADAHFTDIAKQHCILHLVQNLIIVVKLVNIILKVLLEVLGVMLIDQAEMLLDTLYLIVK